MKTTENPGPPNCVGRVTCNKCAILPGTRKKHETKLFYSGDGFTLRGIVYPGSTTFIDNTAIGIT